MSIGHMNVTVQLWDWVILILIAVFGIMTVQQVWWWLASWSFCNPSLTPEEARYSSWEKKKYQRTLGVMLIYDVTRQSTFDHLPLWLSEVRSADKVRFDFVWIGRQALITLREFQ